MSLADQIRAEGRQEGLREGLQEGEFKKNLELAKKFLNDGVDLSIVAKNTGYSVSYLDKLKKDI